MGWINELEAVMSDQHAKCVALEALHKADEAWVIPNPWDVGSARDLETVSYTHLTLPTKA